MSWPRGISLGVRIAGLEAMTGEGHCAGRTKCGLLRGHIRPTQKSYVRDISLKLLLSI